MKAYQISVTAIMTAFLRAYHSTNEDPVIFHDALAYALIPEERRHQIEQGLKSALQAHDGDAGASLSSLLQTMGLPNVVSRARYTEERLEIEIQNGVKQYVILGAGLDTFAFRHQHLLKEGKLEVFEVDHPATQAFKRERLTDLGWDLPAGLHFVSTDFRQERVAEALARTPYNPRTKSLFSLLGVTMYLSPYEVYETFHSISQMAPAGSSVIFDYHTEADANLREIRRELQKMGESMQTTFDPALLNAELRRLGFDLVEDLSPAVIQERYFQDRAPVYHANENVHLAWAVIR
ncbi:class I SAM-dependent methyltransferase [Alicyclobacillus sp.]|uniref:class I SAM-dependent methyltransferase n=1 Tax=Alicyclobacillus sp. TaxID=61169 RepID=UPI0025C623F9|nr:class I SAM-dependent methyltransferase [Alicyclobacillus sp.]MCL6516093.1 class I SAM-dependent methyltransferase [Alicyclobacillus sp.]